MENQNIEWRLQQLENELLPHRVAKVEFITSQLQGEISAVKEIARGIGVKLDAGIEKLGTNSLIELGQLRAEQTKAMSFIRGVTWVFSSLVVLVGLLVTLSPFLRRILGE